jgi:hypothetical protein
VDKIKPDPQDFERAALAYPHETDAAQLYRLAQAAKLIRLRALPQLPLGGDK